jgi:hypothetical protein
VEGDGRPRIRPASHREGELQLAEEAEKPVLVTRFNKDSEEWSTATYYNARSGEPCSITTAGGSGSDNVIPVRSQRSVVNAYVNKAENPQRYFLLLVSFALAR